MKNANYNLVKMLHNSLDDLWRIEKYYKRDAKKIKCKSCLSLYDTMQKDVKQHIKMLQEELKNHTKGKKFN